MSKKVITDKWVEKIISKGSLIQHDESLENKLSVSLIEKCYAYSEGSKYDVGILLASAFDLLVTAEYYSFISHNGWLYCPDTNPRIFFNYTNCCPRHVISNKFYFHPSNKPTSGKIGTATSKLLLLFFNNIFRYNDLEVEVLKGSEPVDSLILNRKSNQVLFAEIKASPLLTLALSTNSERLTKEVDGDVRDEEHTTLIHSHLLSDNLEIFIPIKENGKWIENYFDIGKKESDKDNKWVYRGFIELLRSNEKFLPTYFEYWISSFNSYYPQKTESIFWLTNACGTPSPIPKGWKKRRNGSGYESISDSKTSVGMDRTDDIKKGIYQVLKLGAEGKPKTKKWDYKVGVISNIHPARHFESYLSSLKDIVWTNDHSRRANYVKDLPEDQRVFNLFDGIIALTSSYSRDKWLDELFIETLKK